MIEFIYQWQVDKFIKLDKDDRISIDNSITLLVKMTDLEYKEEDEQEEDIWKHCDTTQS